MQEPSKVRPVEQNLPPYIMETAQELPPNQGQDFQPIYPTSRSPAPPGNLAPPPYPTTSMPGGQPPVMYHTAYPASQVVTAPPPGTYPTYYSSVPANFTQQQPMYPTTMAPQPHYPPTNVPPYPTSTAPGPHPHYSTQPPPYPTATAPGPHPQYQSQPLPYPTATDFGYQQQYPVYQATNATQPFVGMVSRPKDFLRWSILSMIFCFCPLGLGAVIFSRKTSDAVAKQDWISARRYSSTTLMFNVTSLMFGVMCYFAIISFSIVNSRF